MIKKFELHFHSQDSKRIDQFVDLAKRWDEGEQSIRVQTSGSTGPAKNLKLERNAIIKSIELSNSFFDYQSMNSAVHCLNLDTIGGKMMLFRAMYYNLKLHVLDVNANPIKDFELTTDFGAFVPLQVREILINNPEHLAKFQKIIVGGAQISEDLYLRLAENNISVYSTYGMTETMSHVALKKCGLNADTYFFGLGDVTFTQNEEGCLLITSKSLGLNELKTNDLVKLKNDKQFIYIGRKDFVVNSGGVKLNIENIESKLSKYILSEFYLTAEKDERLGQKLVLILEGEKTEQSINFDGLSVYEKPKSIYYFKKFLRLPSGKIDRLGVNKMLGL